MGNGAVIFGKEDILKQFGERPQDYDKHGQFSLALEYLRKMRMQKLNGHFPLLVTLGSDGVLSTEGESGIYHSKLKCVLEEEVSRAILSRKGNNNGAGDVFGGAFVVRHLENPCQEIFHLAQRASRISIKHIGYGKSIGEKSFDVHTYN